MGKPSTAAEGGMLAFFALIGIFALPRFVPDAQVAWALSAVALVLFCVGVGLAVNGRPAGLVIDVRNRVSLSKFQAAAWTVLVLSALITAAMVRLGMSSHAGNVLDIIIPSNLLAAMGISATSLVATPVVLSQKRNQTPVDGMEAQTADKLGDAPSSLASDGKVYGRNDPALARWMDMFRGDEVNTAASPDLSKVQQFLVTIVVLMAYGGGLWTMFGTTSADQLTSLPDFSSQMAWLVGISHAGYLAYKAAPHGATADPAASVPETAVG